MFKSNLAKLLTLLYGTTLLLTNEAKANDSISAACQQAAHNAGVSLLTKHKAKITSSNFYPETSKNNPYKGSKELIIAFANNGTSSNLLSSPRLLQSVANSISVSCNNEVSIIGFGMRNSGYLIRYYKMPSGMKPGVAIDCPTARDPQTPNSLSWGYYVMC